MKEDDCMKKDINQSNNMFELKIRVCGVIIVDDKVLTVKINDCEFFCLPGGHLELGEPTLNALHREIKEESEIEIQPVKLISVIENFYYRSKLKKNSHEIGFYYLCKPLLSDIKKQNDFDFIEVEGEKTTYLSFRWIPLNELDQIDFRPIDLKEKLKLKNFEFQNYVRNELND